MHSSEVSCHIELLASIHTKTCQPYSHTHTHLIVVCTWPEFSVQWSGNYSPHKHKWNLCVRFHRQNYSNVQVSRLECWARRNSEPAKTKYSVSKLSDLLKHGHKLYFDSIEIGPRIADTNKAHFMCSHLKYGHFRSSTPRTHTCEDENVDFG